jgi:hypothetical protein
MSFFVANQTMRVQKIASTNLKATKMASREGSIAMNESDIPSGVGPIGKKSHEDFPYFQC